MHDARKPYIEGDCPWKHIKKYKQAALSDIAATFRHPKNDKLSRTLAVRVGPCVDKMAMNFRDRHHIRQLKFSSRVFKHIFQLRLSLGNFYHLEGSLQLRKALPRIIYLAWVIYPQFQSDGQYQDTYFSMRSWTRHDQTHDFPNICMLVRTVGVRLQVENQIIGSFGFWLLLGLDVRPIANNM